MSCATASARCTAIDFGYADAMRTIMISHVTTMISSLLLSCFFRHRHDQGLRPDALDRHPAISLFTAVMCPG